MNYPANMSSKAAAEYVGGAKILAALERDHGLKPSEHRHRLKRYLRTHLDAALERRYPKV